MTGLTFCLSGTLSQQKSAVEKLIKAAGGKIAGSVTKAVTHVVAAGLGTGKADEGKAKGQRQRSVVRPLALIGCPFRLF